MGCFWVGWGVGRVFLWGEFGVVFELGREVVGNIVVVVDVGGVNWDGCEGLEDIIDKNLLVLLGSGGVNFGDFVGFFKFGKGIEEVGVGEVWVEDVDVGSFSVGELDVVVECISMGGCGGGFFGGFIIKYVVFVGGWCVFVWVVIRGDGFWDEGIRVWDVREVVFIVKFDEYVCYWEVFGVGFKGLVVVFVDYYLFFVGVCFWYVLDNVLVDEVVV